MIGGKDVFYTGVSVIAEMYWCHKKAMLRAAEKAQMFATWWRFMMSRKEVCPEEVAVATKDRIIFHPHPRVFGESPDELKGKSKWIRLGTEGEAMFCPYREEAEAAFSYKDLRIGAIPDGIGDDWVGEFKVTKLPRYTGAVARCQANLYAFIFQKPWYEVMLYHPITEKYYTRQREVDPDRAIDDLEKFLALIKGEMEPWPCKEWKCKHCDHKKECESVWHGDNPSGWIEYRDWMIELGGPLIYVDSKR